MMSIAIVHVPWFDYEWLVKKEVSSARGSTFVKYNGNRVSLSIKVRKHSRKVSSLGFYEKEDRPRALS